MRPAVVVLALATACTSPTRDSESTWQGTITTDANVTTVLNQSGSVWRRTATLVEDLSIGVETGADAYMFGNVTSVAATDEHIYVVDYQIPAVRIYDATGAYVRDLGGPGEGPGEYDGPNDVQVGTGGRVFVREGSPGGRINVYTPDGSLLDTWYGDRMLASGRPMTLLDTGQLYTQALVQLGDTPREFRLGMGEASPDGIIGDVIPLPNSDDFGHEEPMVESGRNRLAVPFAARVATAMSPSGAIIAGLSSEYRFEIEHPDGRTMIVERGWEPVPIHPDEADWHRRRTIGSGRRSNPGWTWNGAEIPPHKPAFTQLFVDQSKRIWVRRPGPGERVADCDAHPEDATSGRVVPCWRDAVTFDVFDEHDGRFLGQVAPPPAVRSLNAAYIRDDVILTAIEDESGTIMVKRYRLTLLQEEHQ